MATRHGHKRNGKATATYKAWCSMIQRCTYPHKDGFELYGGRGITVCERWRDFVLFLADMGERPSNTTLDRFPNSDGNYEPGNCRWATVIQQANNKRTNVRVTHGGRTLTIAEWSRETGIGFPCLYGRLFKYGWHPSEAFTRPPKKGGNHAIHKGATQKG